MLNLFPNVRLRARARGGRRAASFAPYAWLAASLLLGGCYSPKYADCWIRCSEPGDQCPDDMQCIAGGWCVHPGTINQCVSVEIEPLKSEEACAGREFSATLKATGGAGPYEWKPKSALPAGLTLDSSGHLSGTLSMDVQLGKFTVVVEATSDGESGARSLDLQLSDCPRIGTQQLPAACAGHEYEQPIEVSGGDADQYVWTVNSVQGNEDPVTSPYLSVIENRLVGTLPEEPETYHLVLTVNDNRHKVDAKDLSLDAKQCASVAGDRSYCSTESIRENLNQTINAESATWRLESDHQWLSLSSEGILTGTPPGPGSYKYSAQARVGDGAPTIVTGTLDVSEDHCDAPAVNTQPSKLSAACIGSLYRAQLPANTPQAGWAASASLPAWLTVSEEGVLEGTPLPGTPPKQPIAVYEGAQLRQFTLSVRSECHLVARALDSEQSRFRVLSLDVARNTEPLELTAQLPDTEEALALAIAPGGAFVSFLAGITGSEASSAWVGNSAGSHVTQVLLPLTAPRILEQAWSTDGTILLVLAEDASVTPAQGRTLYAFSVESTSSGLTVQQTSELAADFRESLAVTQGSLCFLSAPSFDIPDLEGAFTGEHNAACHAFAGGELSLDETLNGQPYDPTSAQTWSAGSNLMLFGKLDPASAREMWLWPTSRDELTFHWHLAEYASPDLRWVARTEQGNGSSVHVFSSAAVTRSSDTAPDWELAGCEDVFAWSGDGSRVACRKGSDLVIWRLDGAAASAVTLADWSPIAQAGQRLFSSDAKWLVSSSGTGAIVADLRGTQASARLVVPTDAQTYFMNVLSIPDGFLIHAGADLHWITSSKLDEPVTLNPESPLPEPFECAESLTKQTTGNPTAWCGNRTAPRYFSASNDGLAVGFVDAEHTARWVDLASEELEPAALAGYRVYCDTAHGCAANLGFAR